MKKLLLVLLTITLFTSCLDVTQSSDIAQREQQEKMLQEGNRQIGMPAITNYNERKLFKLILELRDKENMVTYCYLSDINGKVGQFIGKGIGYGIPAATQFTNPQKIESSLKQGGYAILPQADPNGLFMPQDARATWYMLIDKDGNPRAVYLECDIIVSPIPLN